MLIINGVLIFDFYVCLMITAVFFTKFLCQNQFCKIFTIQSDDQIFTSESPLSLKFC